MHLGHLKNSLCLLLLLLSSAAAYATDAVCSFIVNDVTNESVSVHQSRDAGAYYCEHGFCITAQAAQFSPQVGSDANGEKLVGFLHVEPDEHLFGNTTYSQAKRHHKTRLIMGMAIKGYFSELVASQPAKEGYTILLMGYEKFEWIVNNPTQDFVRNQENIDAAMKIAFGSNQQRISVSDDQIQYVITVNGAYKLLAIALRALSVDDQALNHALPEAIRSFNPNAMITMGVGPKYMVEVRASDRGLTVGSGWMKHDPSSPQTMEQANYSLWNAIQRGSKPL